MQLARPDHRWVVTLTLCALSLPFCSRSALAQVPAPAIPDNGLTVTSPIGTPPHADADGTNESVNLANGALTVYVQGTVPSPSLSGTAIRRRMASKEPLGISPVGTQLDTL